MARSGLEGLVVLHDPLLVREQQVVGPARSLVDDCRSQINLDRAAPTGHHFKVEAFEAFGREENRLIGIGIRVAKQRNADLGANMVDPKFVEDPVPQTFRERVGPLEDLVEPGPRHPQAVGEMGRRNALPGEFRADQLLVLILLAHARLRICEEKDRFRLGISARFKDRLRRQVPVRHYPSLPGQNVYGMA